MSFLNHASFSGTFSQEEKHRVGTSGKYQPTSDQHRGKETPPPALCQLDRAAAPFPGGGPCCLGSSRLASHGHGHRLSALRLGRPLPVARLRDEPAAGFHLHVETPLHAAHLHVLVQVPVHVTLGRGQLQLQQDRAGQAGSAAACALWHSQDKQLGRSPRAAGAVQGGGEKGMKEAQILK